MSEFCSRGPVWSNGTIPEGTVLGRPVGGDVKPLTPAEVATILSTPSSSTIGNLLTADQSTPATGQLTLSGCTEASGLVLTASESAAYSAYATVASVVAGQTWTAMATLAPVGRACATRISWRDSGGAEISAVAGDSIAAGATGVSMAVGVAPSGAVSVRAFVAYAGTGTTGDTVTVTRASFHGGAGGEWVAPGVPVPNLGTKVSHPNVDDVLVQRWDSGLGRWQTVHYDSGWRNVSSLMGSNWTAEPGYPPLLRRVGNTLFASSGGATALAAWHYSRMLGPLPSGFRVQEFSSVCQTANDGVIAPGAIALAVNSGVDLYVNRMSVFTTGNQDAAGTQVWLYGAWLIRTGEAIPTSLPGTLVSSAPYN